MNEIDFFFPGQGVYRSGNKDCTQKAKNSDNDVAGLKEAEEGGNVVGAHIAWCFWKETHKVTKENRQP